MVDLRNSCYIFYFWTISNDNISLFAYVCLTAFFKDWVVFMETVCIACFKHFLRMRFFGMRAIQLIHLLNNIDRYMTGLMSQKTYDCYSTENLACLKGSSKTRQWWTSGSKHVFLFVFFACKMIENIWFEIASIKMHPLNSSNPPPLTCRSTFSRFVFNHW